MLRTVFICFFVILSFLSPAQSDSSKQNASRTVLESGHLIRLVLARDIGSSVAQTGNKLYFTVDSAVIISGVTVIPKGANAYGTLTNASERKSFGRGGNLTFSIEKIVFDNGSIVLLSSDYNASGRSTKAQMIAETALLSPLFVFKKGKDITYKEGKPFVAFVTQDYPF